MENRTLKKGSGSHPHDSLRALIDWYTRAAPSVLGMFNPFWYALTGESMRDGQPSPNPFLALFGASPASGPQKAEGHIAALQNELDARQEKIDRLQAELNDRANILRSQEERISKLKSELSGKKRELTLKKRKIEIQSKRISDLEQSNRSLHAAHKTQQPSQRKRAVSDPLILPPAAP